MGSPSFPLSLAVDQSRAGLHANALLSPVTARPPTTCCCCCCRHHAWGCRRSSCEHSSGLYNCPTKRRAEASVATQLWLWMCARKFLHYTARRTITTIKRDEQKLRATTWIYMMESGLVVQAEQWYLTCCVGMRVRLGCRAGELSAKQRNIDGGRKNGSPWRISLVRN